MIPRYKDIIELIKKGSTVEAQEKIMQLREAAIEIQEDNELLRKRIKELEKEIQLKHDLTWEKPYYWLKTEAGKEGPYCQLCFDKEHKLIRLQGGNNGRWHCHSCKSNYYDGSYKPPERRSQPTGVDSWHIP